MMNIFFDHQFTATQWSSRSEKSHFCRLFVDFIRCDFFANHFTLVLYKHLSGMFHHIAHYNREGFYAAQFGNPELQLRFLKRIYTHRAVGDPAFTWSDVELRLQAYLRDNPEIIQKAEERYRNWKRNGLIVAARESLDQLDKDGRDAVLAEYMTPPGQVRDAYENLKRVHDKASEVFEDPRASHEEARTAALELFDALNAYHRTQPGGES